MFGGPFRYCVGDALVHIWGIGWCLKAWRFGALGIVSVDLSWLSAFVHL